jgi:hypothetical protein
MLLLETCISEMPDIGLRMDEGEVLFPIEIFIVKMFWESGQAIPAFSKAILVVVKKLSVEQYPHLLLILKTRLK